jgi:hypothetical protein
MGTGVARWATLVIGHPRHAPCDAEPEIRALSVAHAPPAARRTARPRADRLGLYRGGGRQRGSCRLACPSRSPSKRRSAAVIPGCVLARGLALYETTAVAIYFPIPESEMSYTAFSRQLRISRRSERHSATLGAGVTGVRPAVRPNAAAPPPCPLVPSGSSRVAVVGRGGISRVGGPSAVRSVGRVLVHPGASRASRPYLLGNVRGGVVLDPRRPLLPIFGLLRLAVPCNVSQTRSAWTARRH